MVCQTHFYNSHTKHKITHSAPAVDSTDCICSSSPSLPVVCRKTPLYHIASSLCISPSCLCMCSHLPPPASSPQVEVRVASRPSLKFIHLHAFLERSHHSFFSPSAPPSCCWNLHIFICHRLAALHLSEDWNVQLYILIFVLGRCRTGTGISRATCEPNMHPCVITLYFYYITDMV